VGQKVNPFHAAMLNKLAEGEASGEIPITPEELEVLKTLKVSPKALAIARTVIARHEEKGGQDPRLPFNVPGADQVDHPRIGAAYGLAEFLELELGRRPAATRAIGALPAVRAALARLAARLRAGHS